MNRAEGACGYFYVIRRGETLCEIAEGCGISLDALLRLNPYLNPAYYLPGQTILLPETPQEETFSYTLKNNERLFDLLRRFENSVADIRILNPQVDVFHLEAGTELTLHRPSGQYCMEAGETLESVAEKFSLAPQQLLQRNPSLRRNEFTAGQWIYVRG